MITVTQNSKKHHWWPEGLQSYWADSNGNVSWIKPNGHITKKKYYNSKISYKRHGHTLSRGTPWHQNFEDDFGDIDNRVHELVRLLRSMKPLGFAPKELLRVASFFVKRGCEIEEFRKVYQVKEEDHRNLLLFLYSLLVRSPANRDRYEKFPSMFGLPNSEEVGKANIAQDYQKAKELCAKAPISSQSFVLLHSFGKKFVSGDGYLDWLSDSLQSQGISGRALAPITPDICLYFCTPTEMKHGENLSSFLAPRWMIDMVNERTQIYSKGQIFFLGKPPKLGVHFQSGDFMSHKKKSDALIDILDEIATGGLSRHKRYLGTLPPSF